MKPNDTTRLATIDTPSDTVCPICDGDSVITFQHSDSFNYGSGDSAVKLHVDLPVRRCTACDFEFIDHEGERIRHEAVCKHLGVLSPVEVRGIREQYGLTRAAFAQVTALGEATLSRWENGAVIQNRAYDRYLRLVRKPGVMQALKLQSAPKPEPPAESRIGERQFRKLVVSTSLLARQKNFQLRPSA